MEKFKRLMAIIKAYMDRGFYGKITVSLEAGNIVNLKVEESIKL
jgi:hypothetical protein